MTWIGVELGWTGWSGPGGRFVRSSSGLSWGLCAGRIESSGIGLESSMGGPESSGIGLKSSMGAAKSSVKPSDSSAFETHLYKRIKF